MTTAELETRLKDYKTKLIYCTDIKKINVLEIGIKFLTCFVEHRKETERKYIIRFPKEN